MNQSKSKQLRKIFAQIAPFPITDPRNKGAFRAFKANYGLVPKNKRAAFLNELKSQATSLVAQTQAVQNS